MQACAGTRQNVYSPAYVLIEIIARLLNKMSIYYLFKYSLSRQIYNIYSLNF